LHFADGAQLSNIQGFAGVLIQPLGTVDGGASVIVAAGSVQQFKSNNSPGGDWQTF